MIKKTLLLFFLFSWVLNAQDKINSKQFLRASFTHSIHVKGAPSATVVNATLSSNNVSSLYEMDFMQTQNFIDEEDSDNGPVLRIRPKKNDFVYTNSPEQSHYSIMRVLMKPFLVKDSVNIVKWKIHKASKNIIGYRCQKATTSYRGRIYTAYFSTEIPFKTGPWKFSNLPGLIMEVSSNDKVLEITINKLEIKSKKAIIDNPYNEDLSNSISWDEFIKEYQKKYNEVQHFRSPNGGTMSMPKEGIEVYIE